MEGAKDPAKDSGGGKELMADMSFRLRTPINAIIGYAEMLQEDADELGLADAVKDLERISLASGKLLRLVDHIVESGEVRDGTIVLRLESTLGSKVRHELRTPVNAVVGYSELLLETLEEGRETLRADLSRIRSSGLNLLSDIDHFFPSGSHRGPVTIVQDPNASAFADSPGQTAPEARQAPEERGRILLVEDSEMSRDMLRRRLERMGYEVVIAETGMRGVEAASIDTGLDLVLLDVIMPDINGLQVLDSIRQVRSRSELPVIMVTAEDHSHDIIAAMNSGANDYLTKPIDFPVAMARIKAALAIAQGEAGDGGGSDSKYRRKQIVKLIDEKLSPVLEILEEHLMADRATPNKRLRPMVADVTRMAQSIRSLAAEEDL